MPNPLWRLTMTHPMIPTWLKIGNKNMWISKAWDPPFNEKSFYECKTIEELAEQFRFDNWCIGTSFIYQNLCFINQIEGGSEWKVIRDDISFESLTGSYYSNIDHLTKFINDAQAATPEQLRRLEYVR
ncbi:hypothetical protein [Bacteroides sp.]|uniref:hypothetical protein n=1 Tax=Bacteroides sp. TaxID=29523 RepID=UPI002616F8B5|nr:hypothetical protein [Bacteroides sp.]MDD3039102.1 hypothetical protein [Bacteroides sp.]